jgi:hypothetical protein
MAKRVDTHPPPKQAHAESYAGSTDCGWTHQQKPKTDADAIKSSTSQTSRSRTSRLHSVHSEKVHPVSRAPPTDDHLQQR